MSIGKNTNRWELPEQNQAKPTGENSMNTIRQNLQVRRQIGESYLNTIRQNLHVRPTGDNSNR